MQGGREIEREKGNYFWILSFEIENEDDNVVVLKGGFLRKGMICCVIYNVVLGLITRQSDP